MVKTIIPASYSCSPYGTNLISSPSEYLSLNPPWHTEVSLREWSDPTGSQDNWEQSVIALNTRLTCSRKSSLASQFDKGFLWDSLPIVLHLSGLLFPPLGCEPFEKKNYINLAYQADFSWFGEKMEEKCAFNKSKCSVGVGLGECLF